MTGRGWPQQNTKEHKEKRTVFVRPFSEIDLSEGGIREKSVPMPVRGSTCHVNRSATAAKKR
jgi:hypothetical protein